MLNKLTLKTKISLGNCASLILVAILGSVAYTGIGSMLSTANWVKHTHLVLDKTTQIEKLLVDIETGERSFLITGKERFLEPYNKGQLKLQQVLEETKELVSDNPKQQQRLENIQVLIGTWVEEAAKPAIVLRRKMNEEKLSIDDVVKFVEEESGKQILIDGLRFKLKTFKTEEQSLLKIRETEAKETAKRVNQTILYGTILVILTALWISFLIAGTIVRPITGLVQLIQRVREGDLSMRTAKVTNDEIGQLASIFNKMLDDLKHYIRRSESILKGNIITDEFRLKGDLRNSLDGMLRLAKEKYAADNREKEITENNKVQTWLKTEITRVLGLAHTIEDLQTLAQSMITELSILVEAGHAVFYIIDNQTPKENQLALLGSYGFKETKNLSKLINVGEGLVGQCAFEMRTINLTEVPSDYIRINSGLGDQNPSNILLHPVLYQKQLMGVIELAAFKTFEPIQLRLLDEIVAGLGITIYTLQEKQRKEQLLLDTQNQAEELQSQQEKLQITNKRLEEQTQRLKASEEDLQNQSEKLKASYEELNEKTNILAQQKIDIEQKAKELAASGKYKSEFLANMSHELRSPLNSLLILSQSLSANKEGNLTEKQVKSAEIIFNGGNDLLTLINDILDLSKVEAGKLDFEFQTINIENVIDNIRGQFNPIKEQKKVQFNIVLSEEAPESIVTDEHRLEQVLKNLLSNAFKFTSKGSVTLKIYRPDSASIFSNISLSHDQCIAFSITDTGIGIPKSKQAEIFEAFQQGEGSITRRFGGTGLGLTISKELTGILGGEIQLTSEEGKGSVFTLFLPLVGGKVNDGEETDLKQTQDSTSSRVNGSHSSKVESKVFVPDDREVIQEEDKSILIIEDDKIFANTLISFSRDRNFKCLSAGDGRNGLQLAAQFKPSAIMLDLRLPDIDGLTVLDQLKDNLETRHIPVLIVSAKNADTEALQKGAMGYLTKPVKTQDLEEIHLEIEQLLKVKPGKVLVVDGDEVDRAHITGLLDNQVTKISTASNGKEAVEKIWEENYDCIILDLELGDMSGYELVEKMENDASINIPPLIIHTGKEITRAEEKKLAKYTNSFVIKGTNSEERLMDDVALFLHSVESSLPITQQKVPSILHDSQQIFNNRKVLLVDDDARNIYALSHTLTEVGMEVVIAANGVEALEKLNEESDIDLVLMDIMMPVMDGFEAMRKIREMPAFKNLPIISLTAKAMVGDKEKCMEAGANEYLTKPVDTIKLLSIIRIWLFENK